MSYCNKTDNKKLSYGIGCYNHGRATDGCSTKFISSCNCRSNAGCLDRSDCGGLRSAGSPVACSGPCQCAEEEIWNSNAPPRPNCRWLSNFVELRRQWSNHSRQQPACCSCKRSCRTLAPCRSPCSPPTPPTCSGAILAASDCQKCCRRLSGGASTSKMAPVDKSSSPNRPLKREAGGGGCSLSCRNHPSTRCNSPNADCSSTASSLCCPSQCGSNTGQCLCQPMPRDCNCPPPIQVDARAARECTCERPSSSSSECACPPSERRFPKTTIKCPNARCSFPKQILSSSKYCCARCQPCCCSSQSCEPCTSSAKRRTPVQPKMISCRSCSPQSSCSSCRPLSTPCGKLTTCSRPSSSCRTGVSCTSSRRTLSTQTQEGKNGSCYVVLTNLGSVGYSILTSGPLTLIFFALVILVVITWPSGLTFYRRCSSRNRGCWKYLRSYKYL
ncbi:keratin-associated protein 10-6 isoform X2 [Pseudomyrmex gracilis]|uniref:keratin-associated protein 10-6 isoform X2 n=1 Tax=Pseudomyrmex gracilis TaxID=219809 RepID=UPI000995AA2C|nr:keratin-associated protein 10-6 isoform X2 [Pseudomyrmex gracilis]